MMLLNILEKIEKETSLDNNLQDAKTELQTIQSKTTPYQHQIALIISRGETTKKRLEGLEKYELENCKKALEELEKIICLSELDKHLLKMINCELKVLNLETEIQQLKNQNSSANTPEQQAKTQKKIEEKEKELKEVKKQSKSEENKHFQISPQILSKFQSIPEFTKEKIESLINPVKDNPEFLQEIQTKHQIEDLNALFTDKSPKEIIVIIKRFEYDNLNSEDKKNKDKKIKTYYQQLNQLAKNGKLTEEQINKYLYKEATGGTSNHSQTYSLQDNNSF